MRISPLQPLQPASSNSLGLRGRARTILPAQKILWFFLEWPLGAWAGLLIASMALFILAPGCGETAEEMPYSDAAIQARDLDEKGRTAEAVTLLREHLEEHPEDPSAHLVLAQIMDDHEQYPEADQEFAEARRLGGEYFEPVFSHADRLARRFLRRADDSALSGAQEAITRALDIAPEDPAALALEALLVGASGDHGRAEEAFERAFADGAEAPDQAFEYRCLYFGAVKGDHQRELASAREWMELRPESAEACRMAAASAGLCGAGSREDAILWARRAVELDPQDLRCHLVLGRLLYDAQDFEAAESAFLAGLELQPRNTDTATHLLLLYLRLQNWTKAEGYILDLVESSAVARRNKARLCDMLFNLNVLQRDWEGATQAFHMYNSFVSPEEQWQEGLLVFVIGAGMTGEWSLLLIDAQSWYKETIIPFTWQRAHRDG